jgi:hypothetical protein
MSGPQSFPQPQARELTPSEREARAKLCFQLHTNVLTALQAGRSALWRLAQALYEFEQERGWLELGYERRTEWLADPEITMTRATYYRLVRAWKVLRVERGLDFPTLGKLDVSKVDIVLPAIASGARKLEDALDDVETLGARDLRHVYWGAKAPEPPGDAEPGQDGGTPAEGPAADSGLQRASDGAAVDAVLGASEGAVDGFDHELEPEDETPAIPRYVEIPCPGGGVHIWARDDIDALPDAPTPPDARRW